MVDGHTIQDPRNEPPRVRPFTLLAAVLVLVLIGGAVVYGGLLLVRTYTLSGDNPYPDSWDPRVEPFVRIVEKERGLDFEHPVRVDFVNSQDFRTALASDTETLRAESQVDPEGTAGVLRAVGMLDKGIDIRAAARRLDHLGVMVFYSNQHERIWIRGTKLTPVTKSHLVHELTHVLQDQHFDLRTRSKLLAEQEDTTGLTSFRAVIEADAIRVEHAWASGLRKEKAAALKRSKAAQERSLKKRGADLPRVVEVVAGAPYSAGVALISLLDRKEGQHAVDRLFAVPPRTDEQLMNPWTFLDGADAAVTVRKPRLGKHEKELDAGTLGAADWLLVLAQRIPPLRALDAVDGWGGDSYVAFTRGGTSCLRATYRGDTSRDTTEMAGALRAWVAAVPNGPASVRVQGKALAFESCDPGARATFEPAKSLDALRVVVTRTVVATGMMSEGLEFAACASNRLVHRFSVKQLLDSKPGPALVRAATAVAAPCR